MAISVDVVLFPRYGQLMSEIQVFISEWRFSRGAYKDCSPLETLYCSVWKKLSTSSTTRLAW